MKVNKRVCALVMSFSGIEKVVNTIESIPKVEWDFEGIHYFDNGPLTVQYLFVLDALNFCFWPGTLSFFQLCFFFHFAPEMLYINFSAMLKLKDYH